MEKKAEGSGKDAAKLLDKAIVLLKMFAERGGQKNLSITGIAKELGVSRSTMYRIIDTLMAHRFLMRDEKTGQYSLGWELCVLGNAAQKSNNLYTLLHPQLAELSGMFGETVSLSVMDAGQGLVVDSIRGTNGPLVVDVFIGDHEPLHGTAYGKALMMDMKEDALRSLFGGPVLKTFARSTPRTVSALYEQILNSRRLGYSIAIDEFDEGVSAVGCPVRDFSGEIIAAVSLATPTVRMTPENISRFSGTLIQMAMEMSITLGYKRGG